MSTVSPATLVESIKAELATRTKRVDELSEELRKAREAVEQFKRELGSALGTAPSSDRAARRTRVLELLQGGATCKSVAAELGVEIHFVRNDVTALTREGLFPLKVNGPDDAETIRRNHIIRVWKYDGRVTCEEDVAKVLKIPVDVALREIAWLEKEGHIEVDRTDEEGPSPPPPAEKIPEPRVTPKPGAMAVGRDLVAASKSQPEPTDEDDTGDDDDDDEPGAVKAATTKELGAEVARQQGSVRTKPVFLTTTKKRDHVHVAKIDRFGDGQTTPDASGHAHRVSKFLVCNAHGHSHDLTATKP